MRSENNSLARQQHNIPKYLSELKANVNGVLNCHNFKAHRFKLDAWKREMPCRAWSNSCWSPCLCSVSLCWSNHSPACRCEWRRTGWCGGSWNPWRCPADGRQRRSCWSGQKWTWRCTRSDTGSSAATNQNGLNANVEITEHVRQFIGGFVALFDICRFHISTHTFHEPTLTHFNWLNDTVWIFIPHISVLIDTFLKLYYSR